MEFLINIFEEELANSRKMEKRYRKELAKLPKGNLSRKCINSHYYYYLQYKENNEVFSKYLGKLSKKQLKEYQAVSKKRRQLLDNLNKVKKQAKVLEHLLNDKKIQSAADSSPYIAKNMK